MTDREQTALGEFLGRVGAEEAEINAAPLKSQVGQDAGDTKD